MPIVIWVHRLTSAVQTALLCYGLSLYYESSTSPESYIPLVHWSNLLVFFICETRNAPGIDLTLQSRSQKQCPQPVSLADNIQSWDTETTVLQIEPLKLLSAMIICLFPLNDENPTTLNPYSCLETTGKCDSHQQSIIMQRRSFSMSNLLDLHSRC